MIGSLIKKIVGSKNERELKRIQPLVEKINQFEPNILSLSDDQLRNKTIEFKERMDRGELLEEVLPEAFAVVPEEDPAVLASSLVEQLAETKAALSAQDEPPSPEIMSLMLRLENLVLEASHYLDGETAEEKSSVG
jgi:hypothetical protein